MVADQEGSHDEQADREGGPTIELAELDIFKSRLHFGLSERIKYSCFDASESWLVCGTTGGSMHIFERGVLKLQRIVPLKDGAVKHVAISEEGSETWIAYACESETVGVILLDRRREEIDSSWASLNVGAVPTCLTWSSSSSPPSNRASSPSFSLPTTRSLFVGDVEGRLTQTFVSSSRHVNFFRENCLKLASFDAPVVQLDEPGTNGRFVLVSTSRRTYVVDAVRGMYVAVGKKARDAPLGACFVPSLNFDDTESYSFLRIFAVRPGRRIWEAEMDGKVVKTLQLPSSLDSTRIVGQLGSGSVRNSSEEPFLAKLLLEPNSRLLVAYSAYFLHFIRPEDGEIVASAVTCTGVTILDVKISSGSIFVQYRPTSGSPAFAQFDVKMPEETPVRIEEPDEGYEGKVEKDRSWDSAEEEEETEYSWPDPAGDFSMMAVGFYSPDIFQFNDDFIAEMSTKMKERFGKWLKTNSNSPKVESKVEQLSSPSLPAVVGTRIATDVKTLVKELGEKAGIVMALLNDPAMTDDERRELGDNWIRYLIGFPDAVLKTTRFNFPASAWAAIVPKDVREVNAGVVVNVCFQRGVGGDGEENGLDSLFEKDEKDEEWIDSLTKVWFLIDGETIIEKLSSPVNESSLRTKTLLWKVSTRILAATNSGGDVSSLDVELTDHRVLSFPKRSWLPRVNSSILKGTLDPASLAEISGKVEDRLHHLEIFFLLSGQCSSTRELFDAFENFWRAGGEKCRLDLAEASKLPHFSRAALKELFENPETRGILVEIGKDAGWLDEEAVFEMLEKVSKLEKDGSRWEKLSEISLRVVGGRRTLEILERIGIKQDFGRRFLMKLMLCCYAEGHHRQDGKLVAKSFSTQNEPSSAIDASSLAPFAIPPPSHQPVQPSQRPFYHWNMEVDVGSACSSCGISLKNAKMLFPEDGKASGIVAFRCGHVYHGACLSNGVDGKSCFICVKWAV